MPKISLKIFKPYEQFFKTQFIIQADEKDILFWLITNGCTDHKSTKFSGTGKGKS